MAITRDSSWKFYRKNLAVIHVKKSSSCFSGVEILRVVLSFLPALSTPIIFLASMADGPYCNALPFFERK